MNRNDDFSAKTRRRLAERAGFRCSICNKPTIGPADDPNRSLSDGIAAHISAASINGPRFEKSLSAEERRDYANGIWACTQHGREIDAPGSVFKKEVLLGLKRMREASAKRDLQSGDGNEDRSLLLLDFPHASTSYELFNTIKPQPYTFNTTSALRDMLRNAESPNRMLALAAELIIETWASSPDAVGVLSTLLSNNIDYWQPSPIVLDKLEQICRGPIDIDEWNRVASVEPLAFALAGQGRGDCHRKLLERLVVGEKWRSTDAARTRDYYGGVGIQYAGIVRHWNDPFRKGRMGLLRANDVARLIHLLLSNKSPIAQSDSSLKLLAKHVKVLSENGASESARCANEFVEGIRYRNNITSA